MRGSRFARASSLNPQERGAAFEKEVVRLLRRKGWWRVKHNVTLRDSHGNISQIDIACGLWRRYYVECKCYSGSVPLKDVAKFSSVLELNGISQSRGIFITNSTYVPRATTIGIRCVDGDELKRWRKQARWRPLIGPAVLSVCVGMIVLTQYLP